jgi:cobalt-zinc-cadmium efflux system outer membrane protein
MLRRLIVVHRALVTAQARVTRLSTVAVPTAETSLSQVRLGFEKGKLAYLDVIDARRTLSETKAALAAALAELNTAAAELEALTGIELPPIAPK